MKSNLRNELVSLYKNQDNYVKFYTNARIRQLNPDRYIKFLPRYGLIVDVGCGYGVLANFLALFYHDCNVIGIDTNRTRIDAANKTIGKRNNITFIAVDAKHWDWPFASGVTMTAFLHHIPLDDQEMVLQSVYNGMAKDGILLISEVDKTIRPVYKYWASYMSDRILYPLSKSYFRASSDWVNILSRIGFTVEIKRLRTPIFSGVLFICNK